MRIWRLRSLGLLIISTVMLFSGGAAVASITTTKHNLSADEPGTYRATAEQRVCLMCHTPHSANPAGPLWNHTLSGATYTPYTSSTLNAEPGQPTGASKLCLSCHDGTVAVGSVYNMPGAYEEWLAPGVYRYSGTIVGLEESISGVANLGIDLRDDHPISFLFDNALASYSQEFFAPATLDGPSGPGVKLDENGEVQCTSCHEPHSSENPKFLRVGYQDGSGFGSPLCRTCHDKYGWDTSKHRNSEAVWNGAGNNPWHIEGQNLANDSINSTPKANGCENCHKPHSGSGGTPLLKYDGEEELCINCHNGNVSDDAGGDPTYDITIPLQMSYRHPSYTSDPDELHNPIRGDASNGYLVYEDPVNLGTNRHAKCMDCHNPHAAMAGVSPNYDAADVGYPGQAGKNNGGTSNRASNVLKGIWGVEPNWGGNWVQPTVYTEVEYITYQYQLCMKCHSYYAFGNDPPEDPYGLFYNPDDGGGGNKLTDQSKEFNPNNNSYHPVTAVGKNDFVHTRSGTHEYSNALLGNMAPTSTMGCVECHSNDTYLGGGAKGPHGSNVWPLLWAPYDHDTGMQHTLNTHLCFKCHDKYIYGESGSSSLWQRTGYSDGNRNLHSYHVSRKDAPCTACHSAVPHGWKRNHLLVYGQGSDQDPTPYNNHGQQQWDGSWNYGLYCQGANCIDIDGTQSGYWNKSVCHNVIPSGPCQK